MNRIVLTLVGLLIAGALFVSTSGEGAALVGIADLSSGPAGCGFEMQPELAVAELNEAGGVRGGPPDLRRCLRSGSRRDRRSHAGRCRYGPGRRAFVLPCPDRGIRGVRRNWHSLYGGERSMAANATNRSSRTRATRTCSACAAATTRWRHFEESGDVMGIDSWSSCV